MARNLELAAMLSFFIYLLPVPEIALNGHAWGEALWRMFSDAPAGQVLVALVALAAAVHALSFALWSAFLLTPGAWKLLFAPIGFVAAMGGTIQLHQCTEQVWWPDWVLSGPEEPGKLPWNRSCSIPAAYLVARSGASAETIEIYLTAERRSATVRVADCRILGRREPEPSAAAGQTVTFDGFRWDAYGCDLSTQVKNWQGVTHSGRRFPISSFNQRLGFGETWESDRIDVWTSRPVTPGRRPMKVTWRLPRGAKASAELPAERELTWWSLSPDDCYLALSVTNLRYRDSVRDFVVVYETNTGEEVFRKYAPALSQTEVQFGRPDRLVFTEIRETVPEVAIYELRRP